jgi:quinohemoprotein ethanol dehydrogenase
MLVFGLGGKATLPPPEPYVPRELNPPPATAAPEVVKAGNEKYAQYCAACHGENGQTRGASFPDLTRTPLLHTQEGFDSIVLQGALAEKGMASFAKVLGPQDTAAIRSFIVARANELKNAPPMGPPPAAAAAEQPHEEK